MHSNDPTDLRWADPDGVVSVEDQADNLIKGWSREVEIRNYARALDVSLSVAVHRLVNTGLSHQP